MDVDEVSIGLGGQERNYTLPERRKWTWAKSVLDSNVSVACEGKEMGLRTD